MTTTVKVTAHCTSDKEAVVEITDSANTPSDIKDVKVLQDGETHEVHVYDGRKVVAYERKK